MNDELKRFNSNHDPNIGKISKISKSSALVDSIGTPVDYKVKK